MGEFLQVRVSAFTYDEAKVKTQWPTLWGLAWEQGTTPGVTHGVLELARTLAEKHRLGILPEKGLQALGSEPERLDALVLQLESALADWKPADADRLSYKLEDVLSELENSAKKM